MKKFMIFLMTIAVIAAFAYASTFIFKVNSISYAGDLNYSDEDYTKWIFGEEEPNALVYKLFADKKNRFLLLRDTMLISNGLIRWKLQSMRKCW